MPKERIDWVCKVSFDNGIVEKMLVSAPSMYSAEAKVRRNLSLEHTSGEMKRMGAYEIRCRAILPTGGMSDAQGVQGDMLSEDEETGTAEATCRGDEEC